MLTNHADPERQQFRSCSDCRCTACVQQLAVRGHQPCRLPRAHDRWAGTTCLSLVTSPFPRDSSPIQFAPPARTASCISGPPLTALFRLPVLDTLALPEFGHLQAPSSLIVHQSSVQPGAKRVRLKQLWLSASMMAQRINKGGSQIRQSTANLQLITHPVLVRAGVDVLAAFEVWVVLHQQVFVLRVKNQICHVHVKRLCR